MGMGDNGEEYTYLPQVERARRKAALHVALALSALGILVVASWLAGGVLEAVRRPRSGPARRPR
jgi:hypothetical protein